MANRFDIHIQTASEAEQRSTFKFMSFGYDATVGVKGFQMLINTWLKCFLTPKGSDPTDTEYGTNFMYLWGSNVPIKDAQDVVALAVETCNEQIAALQAQTFDLTTSERLARASIVKYTERPADPGFDVVVEIQSQANEAMQLNLPSLVPV